MRGVRRFFRKVTTGEIQDIALMDPLHLTRMPPTAMN